MHSSHDQAAGTSSIGDDDDLSSRLLREAEFAVASAISVREQQKARLLAIAAAMSPSPQATEHTARQRWAPFRRGQVDTSPSLHVLGDVLLLLRAASVNVVERVQAWRQHLHQGRPRPYLHDNQNYLLLMSEDTDFLDNVDVLAEWLDFSLRRNPFIITRDGLDQCNERPPSRPETQGGNDNGLMRLPKVRPQRGSDPKTQTTSTQQSLKRSPPPASLVLPLTSILPCDDAVNGSRISAARLVLLEEESFHGNSSTLRAARRCIESCQQASLAPRDPDERQGNISESSKASLYGQLAAVSIRTRRAEKLLARTRQARIDASRILTELEDHVRWIENSRQEDRTKDDHIWRCRDGYRHDALKLCAGLSTSLQVVLTQLDQNQEQLKTTAIAQQQLARTLEQEKEHRLQARKRQQQQQQQQYLQPTKSEPMKQSVYRKRRQQAPLKPMKRSGRTEDSSDASSLSSLPPPVESVVNATLHEHSSCAFHDLERKREAALEERAALLQERATREERARLDLDHRRTEAALMKREDDASREQQRRMEVRCQLKQRRALLDRISATAIFKCSHEMCSKTFLISIYEQKPRGYILEGIRVTAYDPVASSTFSLILSLRQFDSYGYGRSREGLHAFCKWLCLLYEKRKRRFRLVWAGAPCPPPLRIREYDRTLICAHKEGVMLSDQAGYALVAVYVRSDAADTLRFVYGSLQPGNESLVERPVSARHLFAPDDFYLADEDTSGVNGFALWRHHLGALTAHPVWSGGGHGGENFFPDASAGWNECRLLHSGAMIVDGACVDAHVYDANSTEYIIDVSYLNKTSTCSTPEPVGDVGGQSASTSTETSLRYQHRRVILLKHQVSPYPVVLPPDSFGDLLACVTVEPASDRMVERCGDGDKAFTAWRAVLSRKWTDKLAKYVRVLRLARFGCKIAGVFCLVTVYLVQLKTEFRAHLLLELTPVSANNGDGSSVMKQSLYVSLSDYLRCRAVTRRLGLINDLDTTEECRGCAGKQPVDLLTVYYRQCHGRYSQHQHIQEATSAVDGYNASMDALASCPGCVAAQTARVGALRDLFAPLLLGDDIKWSQETLSLMVQVVHIEHCDACGAVLPSLLAVVEPELSSRRLGLTQSMERYYLQCSTTSS